MTAKDRAARLEIHKLHVVTLLASARIRNHWASDELLQVG
jgi:xeroderma pigmentosum group C-complementing protein